MRRRWWAVAALVVGAFLAWGWEPPEVLLGRLKGEPLFERQPATYWRKQLTAGPGPAAKAREQLEAGGGWSLPVLKELLKSEPHPDAVNLRLASLEILGKLGTEATPLQKDVLALLADPDEHVRTVVLSLLPKLQIGAKEALPKLQSFFDKPEAVVALRAASEYRGQAASLLPALQEILRDKSRPTEVRWNAARTLGKIGFLAAGSVPTLIEFLPDPEPTIREHCAEALGDIGPSAAERGIPALLPLLKDPNTRVRRDTVRSLGQLGPAARETIPQIQELAKDPEAIVREAVEVAVRRLEGTEEQAPAGPAGSDQSGSQGSQEKPAGAPAPGAGKPASPAE